MSFRPSTRDRARDIWSRHRPEPRTLSRAVVLGCLGLGALGGVNAIATSCSPHSTVSAAQVADLVAGLPDGLDTVVGSRGHRFSGGEKQRVAIARALINNPEILLADEPTGALDSYTEKEIMSLLLHLNREGKTMLIVTHDPKISELCSRTVQILDGREISSEN